MKGRRLFLSLVLAALVALALAGAASAAKLNVADQGGSPLSTTLTGAAEVPGPGDPDGSGTATTAAHIHVGEAGTAPANNVVVTLSPPDASGSSSGCTTVDRELAVAILENPENYYVNVHTVPFFEAGAIRGQLS